MGKQWLQQDHYKLEALFQIWLLGWAKQPHDLIASYGLETMHGNHEVSVTSAWVLSGTQRISVAGTAPEGS